MVNYDLPWNPNRLEQRFGRIHRIGQTEVCHLWNLVADETREGDVYRRLLERLEQARQAPGGQVFDVLGMLEFEGRPLRELLLDAIRYGEQPEVRARLDTAVDQALDRATLQDLLEERQLVHDAMDASRVQRVREEMERAAARRLQPHYIESFFHEAFRQLGGSARQREPRRYQVSHVPALIRNRDRVIGDQRASPPPLRTDRVREAAGRSARAAVGGFRLPGPSVTRRRHRPDHGTPPRPAQARRGPRRRAHHGTTPRVLFSIEHALQDAGVTRAGGRRVVSKRVLYVELDNDGVTRHLHYAPYLDYRPLAGGEPAVDAFLERPECAWIGRDLERAAQAYAVGAVVPEHLAEVRAARLALIDKTEPAVKDRLTKEISYWDHRAAQLALEEGTGKTGARLNSGEARRWADTLQRRLQTRLEELKRYAQISPRPPVVLGGLLVVPQGLVDMMTGRSEPSVVRPDDTLAVAARARHRDGDRARPRLRADRPRARQARLRHREPGSCHRQAAVHRGQGTQQRRRHGHRHEERDPVLAEKPDDFILALVLFGSGDDDTPRVRYVRRPFQREPDFGAASVNYALKDLLASAEDPRQGGRQVPTGRA